MRAKILFVGGSLNQTTIVHQVAQHLTDDHDCFFTPFFADGLLGRLAARGMLDFTILGGSARRMTDRYLEEHHLPVDLGGTRHAYDLVVTTTDLIVPASLRGIPMVLIQEGMTDPEDLRYHLVKRFRLPRVLANTSMTGLSHAYRAFCVASEGYRELFVRKGVRLERIWVTGIPNFDNVHAYLQNDFPHRHHVLAATSCLREALKYENRAAFIRKTLEIADGRPVIFKLHPNERIDRATREIERLAPHAEIYANGNTNHMIANCDVLVTRYSSVVLVAAALGKEIHADIPAELLRRLTPLQTGGTSARRIADVCREVLDGGTP